MASDLSYRHEPVTGLFAGLDCPRLSRKELLFFEKNGFVTGISALNEVQLNALRSEIESLMQPGQAENPLFYEYNINESDDPSKRLFHALGAWRVSEAFHDLIFTQGLGRIAEQILGGKVRFWHDQLFVKPANDGAVVAWHQDYSYWTRTVPMAHLTCWIGLDDSDESNGCVQYVPGSHRWDLLPREHLAKDMNAILEYLTDEQKEAFRPVPSILKAGEASFHHPMTVHGSFENASDRPRRGVVVNFMKDGVRSDTDEPLLAGVPVIRRGKKIDGRFFPLLSQ